MFYSVDGNIVKLEGGFPQRKVKSLTFQVEGTYFPLNPYDKTTPQLNDRASFYFESAIPQSVIVYFGDGEIAMYSFELENGKYVFGWRGTNSYMGTPQPYDPPIHIYQDQNIGVRNVVFEFENLSEITFNPIHFCSIIRTPENWEYTKIERIDLLNTLDVIELKKIPKTTTYLRNQSTFQNKLTKIPDQWFESGVETLYISQSFEFRQSNNLKNRK